MHITMFAKYLQEVLAQLALTLATEGQKESSTSWTYDWPMSLPIIPDHGPSLQSRCWSRQSLCLLPENEEKSMKK